MPFYLDRQERKAGDQTTIASLSTTVPLTRAVSENRQPSSNLNLIPRTALLGIAQGLAKNVAIIVSPRAVIVSVPLSGVDLPFR